MFSFHKHSDIVNIDKKNNGYFSFNYVMNNTLKL